MATSSRCLGGGVGVRWCNSQHAHLTNYYHTYTHTPYPCLHLHPHIHAYCTLPKTISIPIPIHTYLANPGTTTGL
ncbi:hypothetical protein EON63_11795, partial [archaeon]